MRLETNRLLLIPLTLKNLTKSIIDNKLMAQSIGLVEEEELDDIMKGIYQAKINMIEEDPSHFLFYTYWQIVLNENNNIVGEIGFKGMPNEIGQIEIGYGTKPKYQGKGYMSEALEEFIRWTFEQKEVTIKSVLAKTNRENIASQKVLIKCGFNNIKEDSELYYWEIKDDNK